jgi:hypothetical protein
MSSPVDPESVAEPPETRLELTERLSAWLRLDFLDSYVRWREACEDVRLAYQRWGSADRLDYGLAFAAFCAALDREGHAARVHANRAGRIRAECAA